MNGDYAGRQVVGMDLHRHRSVLVRMSEDGRKLGTARIANSPAALRAELARAGENPRVVLEATYGWYWAADTLAAAGAEVHLAHPLGVKAYGYQRVKTDARDAANLADLLRMGRLPEAWITPREVRDLRELTRYRQKLAGLRSSCKDQVHAVLAKLGMAVTCSDLFGAWGSAWMDGLRLPQPYAGKVISLRQLIGELNTEITMLTEVIGRPAGRACRLPGDPAAARDRPGPGRGDHRRDRRRDSFPGGGAAAGLGGADPQAPRVRCQCHPRSCHQAGSGAAAVGADRGDPARPRRLLARRCQGCDHRPAR
jgi:Transposase